MNKLYLLLFCVEVISLTVTLRVSSLLHLIVQYRRHVFVENENFNLRSFIDTTMIDYRTKYCMLSPAHSFFCTILRITFPYVLRRPPRHSRVPGLRSIDPLVGTW